MLDWSLFEQRTDGGTLLVGMTMKGAELDLDQFCFAERTGVPMPRGERLHMVPWKSVLAKLEMSPGDIDRKKLLSALEKDLDGYETAQANKRSMGFVPSIDPKELKETTGNLHKVFTKYKSDELEIGVLSAFYTVDFGGDVEENKSLIRSVMRHPSNMNVFSIGAGGAPRVRRLQSATGKKTGLDPFDTTRKPRKNKNAEA